MKTCIPTQGRRVKVKPNIMLECQNQFVIIYMWPMVSTGQSNYDMC